MIQKKVCMIGTSSVGKTSLVAKFVRSEFAEKYQTSVGVKIDSKKVTVDGAETTLVLWDLAGDDDFQRLNLTYLRGTQGFLYVADGTRAVTIDQVVEVQARIRAALGEAPCVLALNKSDLEDKWEMNPARMEILRARGWLVILTSAKTGQGVEEAFTELTRLIQQAKA